MRSDAPSWSISLAVHAALVVLLGLAYFPLPIVPPASLVFRSDDEIEELVEEPIRELEVTPVELQADSALDEALPQEFNDAAETTELAALDELAFAAPTPALLAEMLPFSPDAPLLETLGGLPDFTAGGLEGRSAAGRARLVRRAGGSPQSEKSVEESLDWLARHQHPEGFWSFDHRLEDCDGACDHPGNLRNGVKGATGLALLPFLGAGNTPRDGRHEEVVARGIDALVTMIELTPHGGSLYDGGEMYSHGIAAMALCEAYAMTGDESLRAPAQAAINFTCYAQDPEGGGWRYKPRQRGDTSVMGWQIGALKSGYLAELAVPPIVPAKAGLFLDSVSLDGGEAYFYEREKTEFRPATTAIGLLCRMYLGAEHDNPVLARGVARLAELGPSKTDAYFNYYATQVVFQFTGGEGPLWDTWNKQMRDFLIAGQAMKGHVAGSWAPQDGDHGKDKGGRLYATALNCMTLEVYYRLLPIYGTEAFAEGFEE